MVTAENVSKYFLQSKRIVKAHTNHQRQGFRSTKAKKQILEPHEVDAPQEVEKKERDVYAEIVDLWGMTGTIH